MESRKIRTRSGLPELLASRESTAGVRPAASRECSVQHPEDERSHIGITGIEKLNQQISKLGAVLFAQRTDESLVRQYVGVDGRPRSDDLVDASTRFADQWPQKHVLEVGPDVDGIGVQPSVTDHAEKPEPKAFIRFV